MTGWIKFLALSVALLTPAWLAAQSIDVETLRRRQDTQQRAREMARELVSGVLDVQLQQLEENGLSELPIYRDVQQMRVNLDGLVEAEMNLVVQLLVKAQQQAGAEREGTFIQARQRIREVVVRLTVERQNLLRRLKTAELAAQVKRIIERESVVFNVTEALPTLPNSQKTAKQLSIEQDQRDVKVLYLRLVETLGDVRGWGGEVGRGASDGLGVLQAAQVSENLDASLERLAGLDYNRAKTHEANVLKGLRLLLDRVEETQGLIGADREAALELVRDAIKQQEKVREQTRSADLSGDDAQKLVDREQALQKDLAKLPEALQQAPAAQPLAELAKSAAAEATSKLFNAERDQALAAQEKVLGNLLEIERRLADEVQRERVDRSAAELREEVKSLEKTKQALAKTDEQLKQAQKTPAADQPKQSAPLQKQAEQIAERAKDDVQPNVVRARTQDAAQAAQQAAEQLAKNDEPTKKAAELQKAEQAVDKAQAETEAALADAKRKQLAAEIGEVARAAELLSRAAAEERDLADKLSQPETMPQKQAEVESVAEEQRIVDDVVARTSEALRELDPELTREVEKARALTAQTAEQLKAAAQAKQPQPKALADAAKNALNAEQALQKATAKLRKHWEKLADKLDAESEKQLAEVQPVREAIEEVLRDRPKDAAEKLAALREAGKQIDEARMQQLKAQGKHEQAEAMQQAARVADALAKQNEADQAALDHAQGRTNTPLDAALAQERTADAIREAAKKATAGKNQPSDAEKAMAQALNKAAQQAADAAKRALDGDEKGAQQAREQVRQQLAAAAEQAQAAIDKAKQQPAGTPDASAQKRVTDAARDAAEKTRDTAPEANESLAQAEQASTMAEERGKQGDHPTAQQKQVESAAALERAKQQLAKAERDLVQELAGATQKQSQAAAKLAEQAKRVDPAAQASLQAATKPGMTPPDASAATPKPAEQPPTETPAQKQLAAAENKIREAQREQEKAAGKVDENIARKLTEQVAKALQQQSEATQAGELAQNTPGERAKAQQKQQQAAEQVQRAAEQAAARPQAAQAKKQPGGDELAEKLAAAAKLGAEAHDKMQMGQFAEAGKSQEQAQQALQKAAELAAREAAKAMEAPRKTDVAAQQKATAAAKEAAELTKSAVPGAKTPLDEAAQASDQAEKRLKANEPEMAEVAQTKADQKLADALAAVKQAQAVADQEARELAAKQTPPGPMPSTDGTPPESPPAEQAVAAQQQVERSLQRAAASVAERESRVLRDQSLAQALKQAAQMQQKAAEQIAQARNAASGQAPMPGDTGSPMSPMPDGGSLDQALENFADAQKIAGQAAEEITGQREIANDALRAGLQLADQLGDESLEPSQGKSPAAPENGAPPAGAPSGPMPGAGPPLKMGTQFSPNSPEATAEQLAGPQAMAQLAKNAQSQASNARSQQNSGQQNSTQAQNQSTAASQSMTTTGNARPNSAPAMGVKNAGKGPTDGPSGVRTFRDESWIAKLPPELRAAIRSQSQRRAPAAYEERLKRYFENVE